MTGVQGEEFRGKDWAPLGLWLLQEATAELTPSLAAAQTLPLPAQPGSASQA